MKEEKRTAKRINKALFARYTENSDTKKVKWDMANIKNISEAGMCMPTNECFQADKILTILIKIPLKPLEWIQLKGKVVSSERIRNSSERSSVEIYLVRIKFLDLNEESRELLRQYVALFKA